MDKLYKEFIKEINEKLNIKLTLREEQIWINGFIKGQRYILEKELKEITNEP